MKVAKVAGEGEELQTLNKLKMFEQNCAASDLYHPTGVAGGNLAPNRRERNEGDGGAVLLVVLLTKHQII